MIQTFFISIPKIVSGVGQNDSHDDPQIRKRERQGIRVQEPVGMTLNKVKQRKYADKYEDPIYDFSFSRIAARYLRNGFIIDIAACLPLFILEVKGYYYFDEESTIHEINNPVY